MVTKNQTDTFSLVVDALTIVAAAPDGIISSDHIGQQLGLNPVVVRRLLAPLRAAGLLETRRGAGGGWALARDPAALHLGDVYRALRVPDADRTGRFAHLMARAEVAFVAELDGSTLADIIP
jgi:DNA-binding IscR family transcriptional regulator